jgi:hypothetical protein
MPVLVSGLAAILGPGPQVADVGPVYDLLLATRDGSTLPCKNKDGQVVNVAKLAFMTSIDRQEQQQEETELQHKDQLVQLASPNLNDREFNQWPQVSQGDWSGGAGQRVFTGATPITGGAESDPTRYWDGSGLIWPLTDYLVQNPFSPPPIADTVGNVTLATNITSGFVGYFGTPGPGFAWIYDDGVNNQLVYIGGFTAAGTRLRLTNPVDIPAHPGFNQGVILGAHQALWYTFGGNLDFVLQNPAGTLVATHFDSAVAGQVPWSLGLVAGTVGNKNYIVWILASNPGGGLPLQMHIRLYDLGNTGTFSASTATVIDLPPGMVITGAAFLGSDLMIGCTDGTGSTVFQYSIPSATFTTVARIHNSSGVRICEAAGSLFVASVTQGGFGQETISLFLLQGGNLQSIGPLAQGAYFKGSAQPVTSDEYAFLAAQDLNNNVRVYAYDVVRGRLFRVASIPAGASWGQDWDFAPGLVAIPMLSRPAGAAGTAGAGNLVAFTAQWGLLVPTQTSSGGPSAAIGQELYWGIQQQGAMVPVQQGCDILSSLIDFTASEVKLFRDVVLTLAQPGLSSNAASSVIVNVWLDRDPQDIVSHSIAPDFTTGVVASGVGGGTTGQTRIRLPINQVAIKLVYEIVTAPASFQGGAFVSAPRLQSIVIRAAVGWTRTLTLAMADRLQSNGKGQTDAWQLQQPPGQPAVDAMVARDFLRQLWRLEGGECIAVFPGFDPPANWLLQDFQFNSPKPFGARFRADQPAGLSSICRLKLREDV